MVRISGENLSKNFDEDMTVGRLQLLKRETVAADLAAAGELNAALMLSDSQQRRRAAQLTRQAKPRQYDESGESEAGCLGVLSKSLLLSRVAFRCA